MDPRHAVGQATEFRVAAHYASLGWEVFLPTMSQSRADLVVLSDADVLKVQVKKATWAKVGPNEYLQVRLVNRAKNAYALTDFDVLFVLDDDGRMWSIPHRDIEGLTSLCLDSRGPTATKGAYTRKRYNPDAWLLPPSVR